MGVRANGMHCCDLTVIGAGMAGMAGALFGVNRGLSVIQVGTAGESLFASGLLDLLAVHPVESPKVWDIPWEGIRALVQDLPKHPYAYLQRSDIERAFAELLSFLSSAGVDYRHRPGRNVKVLTPVGTIKTTYCVPKTMWAGVAALEDKPPCLLVDVEGFKGFCAKQIAETLAGRWPGIRSIRIRFPDGGAGSDRWAERMAMSLESKPHRDALVRTVGPQLKAVECVGLPAILGLHRAREVHAEVERMMGVPVFEIPTLPVSVPGIRLREAFLQGLARKGVRTLHQHRVVSAQREAGGGFRIWVRNHPTDIQIHSRGVLLATGRFLGQGLAADRTGIRETVFDLPVFQPGSRTAWHREDFFDPKGHPVNRSGIEIDKWFRPLDRSGVPSAETLFAAGTILAHQDWIRMKCGAGLAISSAWAAVKAFMKITGSGI